MASLMVLVVGDRSSVVDETVLDDVTLDRRNSFKEAGFSLTRKTQLGTNLQLPFGFCMLSLKPAKDPVATPYGHIFDREYIINWLATQKAELVKQRYLDHHGKALVET